MTRLIRWGAEKDGKLMMSEFFNIPLIWDTPEAAERLGKPVQLMIERLQSTRKG